MRTNLILFVFIVLGLSSCASVQVTTDYDNSVNFDGYSSYAFYKDGVDKVLISDLDKKRILKAIDADLSAKGLVKSNQPDLIVNIFTKETTNVNVMNNNFGWGWGWGAFYNPWLWGPGWNNGAMVSTDVEGVLYVDVIDRKSKSLIWQGSGSGSLNAASPEKKEARINRFVAAILKDFPVTRSVVMQ